MKNSKIKNKEAYITIMMVIAISAIAVAVVVSLIDSGISSTQNSQSMVNLAKARQYAEACIEESLQNIRDDGNYSGNLNLPFTNGGCSATTNKISDSNFIIQSIASSSTALKKITVTINQTSPKIQLSDWQELADF